MTIDGIDFQAITQNESALHQALNDLVQYVGKYAALEMSGPARDNCWPQLNKDEIDYD